MRLAVLSDIHGNLLALEAVLADLTALGGADLTWCLGDLAALGPRPVECVRRIRALATTETIEGDARKVKDNETFKVIGGNTERYLVNGERLKSPSAKDEAAFKALAEGWATRDTILNWNVAQLTWDDYNYLKKLRGRELAHEVAGYGWVIGVHAVPGNDEAFLNPDTPDEEAADYFLDREGRLAILGHTHRQMNRQIDGWQVVNVGSVGMSLAGDGYAEYGLFAFEGDSVTVDLRRVPVDLDALRADCAAAGHPATDWFLSRLLTPPTDPPPAQEEADHAEA